MYLGKHTVANSLEHTQKAGPKAFMTNCVVDRDIEPGRRGFNSPQLCLLVLILPRSLVAPVFACANACPHVEWFPSLPKADEGPQWSRFKIENLQRFHSDRDRCYQQRKPIRVERSVQVNSYKKGLRVGVAQWVLQWTERDRPFCCDCKGADLAGPTDNLPIALIVR